MAKAVNKKPSAEMADDAEAAHKEAVEQFLDLVARLIARQHLRQSADSDHEGSEATGLDERG